MKYDLDSVELEETDALQNHVGHSVVIVGYTNGGRSAALRCITCDMLLQSEVVLSRDYQVSGTVSATSREEALAKFQAAVRCSTRNLCVEEY